MYFITENIWFRRSNDDSEDAHTARNHYLTSCYGEIEGAEPVEGFDATFAGLIKS